MSLSHSGSGLKTILMVLAYTILLPNIEKDKKTNKDKPLSDYVFLFEELENNLHPSLERRLLKYLEELSKQNTTIFLTTHSNIVLDSFQSSDNVQLYHIVRESDEIKVNLLDNFIGKKNCLDDIGIKASDLLQSNGIIWVEGPSDRIYINKWIDLWSKGKLKEGMDYQCVFYGGRLLSHVTLDTEDTDDLINLLKINKNSIVLIDSDKKDENAKINATKKRIKQELEKSNQFCWITKGREIENYIPIEIVKSLYENPKNCKFELYDDISNLLNRLKTDEGKRFRNNKVLYAKKYIDKMTMSNMLPILDLNSNMKKIIKEINNWNHNNENKTI